MTLNRSRATPLSGATRGTCKAVPASSSENSATSSFSQAPWAVSLIARRFGLSLPMASAVAAANGLGGVQ